MHSTRTSARTPNNPLGLATRTSSPVIGGDVSLPEELVQLITRAVIEALGQRSTNQAAATSANLSAPVNVQPPIGICTGDYSKFPELVGKQFTPAPVAATTTSTSSSSSGGTSPAASVNITAPSPVSAPVLSGIVTASQLQAAMDSASDGVALLSPDARLSPLANDLARQRPGKVRRAAHQAAPATGSSGASQNLPWAWWIDGACPVVQQVTSDRATKLRPLVHNRTPGSLSAVVRELAAAIKGRQVAGGLLFVRSAARAVCLANRCASIRAIVGTSGEAVEQGITELGANVLIIEYPHHGPKSTVAMVDRITQQTPSVPASVERELADLHRCG
jgi:hypothetical protein